MKRSAPKVLVVEDEPDLRICTRDTLRLAGYRVVEADDGPQALLVARGEPLGLVLLDLRLPSMDGLELLRALRADPATQGVPVIVLSATADDAERAQARASGAADYLVKPVGADALLGAVGRLLDVPDDRGRS